VLTRGASERGALVGMVCGLALNLYLWLFTQVSFTWYVVLGSIVTFVVGYAASGPGRRPAPASLRNEHEA
jgi:solute:Na+ symporter, SSS family